MNGFAGFLREDRDAVATGLTHTWSSGVVEGHVNRIKMLKHQMFGDCKSFGVTPDHGGCTDDQ